MLRTVKITWVEIGTNNAAMLGFDETIVTKWTLEECRAAALDRGAEAGVDLDRYDVVVEETPLTEDDQKARAMTDWMRSS